MFHKSFSCSLSGLSPNLITVEVDFSLQLPSFQFVGLASQMVQESKERIRAAVVNSGYEWPARKIVVNLLPVSLPKWGSHLELPIACAILHSDINPTNQSVFAFGELSLNGEVKPCGWLGGIEAWLQEKMIQKNNSVLVVHSEEKLSQNFLNINAQRVVRINSVKELTEIFKQKTFESSYEFQAGPALQKSRIRNWDLAHKVEGESFAKIASLVSIVGRHNVLLAGPHGTGKSMLAKAMEEIDCVWSEKEKLNREHLFASLSMGGEDYNDQKKYLFLQTSATRAALEGAIKNNGMIAAGELVRAHECTLVADEFFELRRDVIECLRQPLEEKIIRLQRARFHADLPCNFRLVATTNLCSCGNLGSLNKQCYCTRTNIERYLKKCSGPILDRFDCILILGRDQKILNYLSREAACIFDGLRALSSEAWERFFDAQIKEGDEECELKSISKEIRSTFDLIGSQISKRGIVRIFRVAKTISQICEQELRPAHIEIASQMRQDLTSFYSSHYSDKILF